MGKAPIGIAKLAKKYHKNVIALVGGIDKSSKKCNKEGINAYFSITNSTISLAQAMDKNITTKNITLTVEQIFNLLKINLK